MTYAPSLILTPGHVYRTADLLPWGANPTRLAGRLVDEGRLVCLRHGLYAAPRQSRFGPVPPSLEALMEAFLKGTPWLLTGPPLWNALGLGATAMFASPLVYNTKRSGRFDLGGAVVELRRTRFPRPAPAEWFVVDLLMNANAVGLSRQTVGRHLCQAVEAGRFDVECLLRMAADYGTKAVQHEVRRAVES